MLSIKTWLATNAIKLIIGLVLSAAVIFAVKSYIDSVYDAGEKHGIEVTQEKWKKKYDEDVDVLNKKIAALGSLSTEQATIAKKEIEKFELQVSELQKKIAAEAGKFNSTIYNKKGVAFPCSPGLSAGQSLISKDPTTVTQVDTEFYLGYSFGAEWNLLNNTLLKSE